MSELTGCNYCSLRMIKLKAKNKKLKVTLEAEKEFELGGINVYTHPLSTKIKKLKKADKEKYFSAWFKELTTHCVC